MGFKPIKRVTLKQYMAWTTQEQMDEICANCGFRYGLHSEGMNDSICPKKENE